MGWDVHEGDGLAHYARACTDVTFRFPFGVQELMGIAARGNFDLTSHSEGSGKSKFNKMTLSIFYCVDDLSNAIYKCI
jgi:glycyl-tRNA synthetase (class II)